MKLFESKLKKDQTTKEKRTKREDKKSVQIKWNSRLFFQLGLIVILLGVYFVMQIKFELTENKFNAVNIDYLDEIPMIIYTLDEPIEIPKKKIDEKQILKDKIKIIKVEKGKQPEIKNPEIERATIESIPTKVPVKTPSVTNKKYNLIGVEFVPIYPGCESLKTNIEKRECMSSKIKKFIIRKFNADNLNEKSISGVQKIMVQFNIDKQGNVSEVRALSKNKSLKEEAIRVVSKLPKMKPGRQGDKIVEVQYMIPIVFKIDY